MKNAWLAAAAVFVTLGGQYQPLAAQELAPTAAAEAAPSAEDFAALPLIEAPVLSPSGSSLLFSYQRNSQTFVAVRSLDGGALKTIAVPEKFELNWYRWAGDERILVSASNMVRQNGTESRRSYLMAADIREMKLQFLGSKHQGMEGDDVLFVDPAGAYVLLSIQSTVQDYPSVWRVRLSDGEMDRVQAPRSQIWEWFADSAGDVRAGIAYDRSTWRLHYRKSGEDRFEQIAKVDYDATSDQELLSGFRMIGGSDQGYVMSDGESGRLGLYRYDYAARQRGEQVFSVDRFDLEDYSLNPDGSVAAVFFTDDRVRTHWFDADRRQVQEAIQKALGSRQATIHSQSRDGKVKLVLVGGPNEPGTWYVFSAEKGTMVVLAELNSKIVAAALGTTKFIDYPARDGRTLHASLTMPPGGKTTGLPLIVMPHGGPFGVRDRLTYDPEVQFLASRGYVVLQPNYRGSGGYGSEFLQAGEGQIGRSMQDDLDDGMDWLAKQGAIDPSRVCMVGSSYGGYAALWAVTRNPERYRCAASFAGVTDWDKMLSYDERFLTRSGNKNWKRLVRGEEKADMDAVSPLQQVAALNRPVLIGQGGEDSNVPPKQAELYIKALKKAGKPYDYRFYEDEGHGFSDSANLSDWLTRLDAFLQASNPA